MNYVVKPVLTEALTLITLKLQHSYHGIIAAGQGMVGHLPLSLNTLYHRRLATRTLGNRRLATTCSLLAR